MKMPAGSQIQKNVAKKKSFNYLKLRKHTILILCFTPYQRYSKTPFITPYHSSYSSLSLNGNNGPPRKAAFLFE
jgi:hypothetical protein